MYKEDCPLRCEDCQYFGECPEATITLEERFGLIILGCFVVAAVLVYGFNYLMEVGYV